MTVVIIFTDLRIVPSKLAKYSVEWHPGFSARQVLEMSLGDILANEIEKDLKNNSHEIVVSWYNKRSGDVSEIGGVGTLDWSIPEDTVLTVSYENESTTQNQIDESIEWTLKQEL